jgi:hypothetical protein
VVMDNLTAHKGERVRELIEGRGCELLYLPPYSPEFNPISRKLLPRSSASCAKPRPVAERLCLRRLAKRSRRLVLRTLTASSSTADTGCWSNHYGERCRAEYSDPFNWGAFIFQGNPDFVL